MHLVFLFFALFTALFAWENSYTKAHAESVEDGKPLLLFFTGSDWSGLAMKMKNEVLDSPSFQKKISSQFHLVEVDFPVHTLLPLTQQEVNLNLKRRFQIDEYPVLLLLDSKEREITRIGYLPENGDQLAEELLHIVAQDTELCAGLNSLPHEENALRHLYELSQSLGRIEASQSILEAGLTAEIPFFQLEQYRLCVEEGKEAAVLREKLLKSEDYQVHFTLTLIDFQARANTLRDPREVIRPLENYLERFGERDQENRWRIEMMIAQFYLDADEWKTALKHAETAYQSAPGSMRGEIENSLHYIRDQIR